MKKQLAFFALLASVHTVAASVPDISQSGFEQTMKWARERVHTAEESFKQKREASPNFWGNQAVYQIQVDRFNNGDQKNDGFNVEDNQIRETQGNDLYGILDYRHGGDLRGIIERLDYIQDLGITSLWITPIFKHNGSYHGYCTSDFTEIDPGFGTKEELRELVSKAHQHGLKVILDIVVNHMCDQKTTYSKQPNHYQCANDLDQQNWRGIPSGTGAQGELAFSSEFFGPMKSQFFFNRCGANSQSDMEGTGPAAVYGDFVSTMFDFNTRNYEFQELFTELHKYWIAYADIDGYRMDAVKHVSEDFIAYFSTQTRNYARSIGKNNFFIVGEVAGPSDWIGRRTGKMFSNVENPDQHGNIPNALTQRLFDLKDIYLNDPSNRYPGLNAAYDFAHGGTALAVLHNKRPPSALEEHFKGSYFNDIAYQNDYRLSWNLLEIHDWPRFASGNIHSMDKSKLGITYLAMAEGSPIIYYGMEQGFNGDCHFDSINVGSAREKVQKECKSYSHALFRQDMFVSGMTKLGSTVPEIDSLSSIGKTNYKHIDDWKNDPFLNRNHQLYRTARQMLNLRQSCNALKFGSTQFRWVDNSNEGVLAFSRIDSNGYEALVVLNTSYGSRKLNEMRVNDFSNGKKWVNLLNTQEVAYTTGRGTLWLADSTIAANSTMLFVPEQNVGHFDERIGGYVCAR